jgi:hypothetical protein
LINNNKYIEGNNNKYIEGNNNKYIEGNNNNKYVDVNKIANK